MKIFVVVFLTHFKEEEPSKGFLGYSHENDPLFLDHFCPLPSPNPNLGSGKWDGGGVGGKGPHADRWTEVHTVDVGPRVEDCHFACHTRPRGNGSPRELSGSLICHLASVCLEDPKILASFLQRSFFAELGDGKDQEQIWNREMRVESLART